MSGVALGAIAGHVVISEVLYDASGVDAGKEWIELYNPTNSDINLDGYAIESGNGANPDDWTSEWVGTASDIIPAHGFFLIGESDVVPKPDYITTLDLQNGPDGVRLNDTLGIIDTVGWGTHVHTEYYEGTPYIDVSAGNSIERKSSLTNNENEGNGWDTNNNSADFVTRTIPQPQNSSNSTEHKANKIVCNNSLICDYITIQGAIGASSSGDTITVAAGTYETGAMIIDKSLTLISDTGDYRTTGTILTNHSEIRLQEDVDNVTIKGFKFLDITDTTFQATIHSNPGVSQSHDNILIESNNFTNLERHAVKTNANNSNFIIRDNSVTNVGTAGGQWTGFQIFFLQNGQVTNNTINTTTYAGINLDTVTDSTISGNTISNTVSSGIQLANSPNSNSVISDNTITNANTGNSADKGAIAIYPNSNDVTIENNILNNNNNGFAVRDKTGAVASDVIVINNKISNNTGFGAVNLAQGGGTLDARNNYWGAATGPNTAGADSVSANVDFAPYYTDVAMTIPSTEYSVCASGCNFATIQAAIDSADAGDTINVSAGTYEELVTINKALTLRGATYNVNKNGYTVPTDYAWDDSVESIIQTSDDNTIVKISADDVTLEGFVIQALSRSSSGDRHLVEVQADGHGKDLENIDIINNVIGPNTNTANQDGNKGRMNLYIALNQYQETPWGLNDSLISGNKIFGSEGNGNAVFIWGAYYAYGARNPSPMTGTIIEDNEICCGHRNGIEIAGGVSDLIVHNNDIHDFSGLPGDDPDMLKYGSGILLIRGSSDKTDCNGLTPEDLTIENNEIYDNEKNAIYMGPNNDGVTISNNDIHENGWDAVRVDLIGNYWNPDFDPNPGPYTCLGGSSDVSSQSNKIYNNNKGIQVIGTPTNGFVLNATINYWGHPTGPSGATGSGYGDNVSSNVLYYPWYTDSALTTLANATTTHSSTIEILTINNMTQDNAEIQINATLSNTGSASAPMYDASIKLDSFYPAFATASAPTQNCGTIPAGSSCTKTFDITINGGTTSDTYDIYWKFNWTNNDLSPSDIWVDGSTVTILDNPVITVVDAINNTINHGVNSTVYTKINSTGNYPLNNVEVSYTAGSLLSEWVSFSPSSVSSIAAGSNTLLDISVAIPKGTSPGDYTGTLTVSDDSAASKQITLNVEVPTDNSWYSYPSKIDTFRKTNVAGTIGTVYINNTGNVDQTYTISYAGTIRYNSGLWDTSNPTSKNVPKQTTPSFDVKHIGNYLIPGSYDLDVTINVGSATNITVMNLILENDNPTIDITNPINNSFVKDTVSFTVTADDLNLSTIKFYIDNTEVFDDINLTKTFNWDTTSGSYPDNIYTLKATAFDSAGNSNTSTITVTVNNTDSAPLVANPLADFSFDEDTVDTSINLNNVFASIDDETLTYSSFINDTSISVAINPSTGIATLTPEGNWTGAAVIIFNASDSAENYVTDDVIVLVNNVQDAPVIPFSLNPDNGTIIISASTTQEIAWESADVDFEDITFSLYFSNDSDNLPLIATTLCEYVDEEDIDCDGEYDVTGLVPNTTYYWTVNAFDGTDYSGNSSIFQFTYLQDSQPEITGWKWNTSTTESSETNSIVSENKSIQFWVNATDIDGDEIGYVWYLCEIEEDGDLDCDKLDNDNGILGTGPVTTNFTYAPGFNDSGAIAVRALIFDNNTNSVQQDWNLTITNTNREPVLDAISNQNVNEDSQLMFNITAFDPDGDSLTFTSNINSISFTNAANNSMATVSWTPTNDYVGNNTIEFIASDSSKNDSETITITVTNVNDAPTITSFSPAEDKTIAEGVGSQRFDATFTDVDTGDDATAYWFKDSINIAPNSSNVTITNLNVGIYNITVIVNDTLGLEDRHEWTLTVTTGMISDELTSPITILNQSERENVTDVTINQTTFGGIDFGNETLNFSRVAVLEDAFNISNGVVSVDTDTYPELNKSASIVMKGLNFTKAPLIYYNDGFSVISGGTVCPETICTDITYDVENGILRFNVPHFSTYYTETNQTNGAPIITSTPVTKATERVQYTYDVDAADPDGDVLIYSLIENPDGMSISSSGVISWTPTLSQIGLNNVTINVSDSNLTTTQSYNITATEGPKLAITELNVKVDGKTDKNLNDGDKIGKEAAPGSNVEFKLKIENLFTDDEDLEIEDIDVEITIEDIDDGDDLEEDAKEFDLKDGKNKKVSIEFKIPLEVEEGIFDVIIDVEGEDENRTTHTIRWEIGLEVEKDDHEIRIIRSALTPSVINCQRQISLNTEIINTGTKDEDDVSLEITSPDLGISSLTTGIELDEGTDDNRFTKLIRESISTDVAPGEYPITIDAYYDSTLSESKTVDLTVEDCELVKKIKKDVKEKKPEVEVIMPPAIIEKKPVAEVSFAGTDEYSTLLAILIVLFLGTAVFVGGAAYIILRK